MYLGNHIYICIYMYILVCIYIYSMLSNYVHIHNTYTMHLCMCSAYLSICLFILAPLTYIHMQLACRYNLHTTCIKDLVSQVS